MYVIAIDGPAGAGKSSVSKQLAQRLGWIRLDTGALYRAIALAASEHGLPAHDTSELVQFLSTLEIDQREGSIYLNGQLEEDRLRTPLISRLASDFATLPSVRHRLLELQRSIGLARPCIVDGRDIGTVVFPDAPLKIYLTASSLARAQRRLLDLQQAGEIADVKEVQREIELRDQQDQNRDIAPLKQADDAHVVDATHLTLNQVVDACFKLAQKCELT